MFPKEGDVQLLAIPSYFKCSKRRKALDRLYNFYRTWIVETGWIRHLLFSHLDCIKTLRSPRHIATLDQKTMVGRTMTRRGTARKERKRLRVLAPSHESKESDRHAPQEDQLDVDEDLLRDQDADDCNQTAPSRQLPAGSAEAIGYWFNTSGSLAVSKLNYRGFMSELQTLFQRSNASSKSNVITTAIATMVFAREHRRPEMIPEANRLYGHSLTLTRRSLDCRGAMKSDEMLLTVLLLGLFEVCRRNFLTAMFTNMRFQHISGNSPSQDDNVHQNVLPRMLTCRGFAQFDNPESRTLFFSAQAQMVRH